MNTLQGIVAFLLGLKPLAQEISLRVEKDSADGWSNEEKEALAVDLFIKLVYVAEPWYIRLVPQHYQIKAFRAAIRWACARAKAWKTK